MKEYIEKQELIDTLNKSQWFTDILCTKTNTYNVLCAIEEFLDKQPTVTQADLESLAYDRGARAFAEKLKERLNYGYEKEKDVINSIWVLNTLNDWTDELLKEMGCCDENEKPNS